MSRSASEQTWAAWPSTLTLGHAAFTVPSGPTMYVDRTVPSASLPHIIFFPALFIALLEISFNLFGNGLRDAFNPSLRGADE